MQQTLIKKISESLNPTQKKFIAELIGTFIVVVLATGSVVVNMKLGGILGVPFVAFAPFVGVALCVYLFGKISMAHFNPAVSVGFLISKHLPRNLILYYFGAEIIGALLGSLFVKYILELKLTWVQTLSTIIIHSRLYLVLKFWPLDF